MICAHVIARFCAPSLDFQTVDSWYGKTELADLLGVPFEVSDSNRVDVTNPQGMIKIMESKCSKANRIWVMNCGMVSAKNLHHLRRIGARYLVGTHKAMLKKFEQQLLSMDSGEVWSGVEVRLCPIPQ